MNPPSDMGELGKDDPVGKKFVARTLRSTAFVTGFIVLMLYSYRQIWAIAPLLIGVALASVLLLGWDWFVRGLFTPDAIRKDRKKRRDRKWALLALALVKYPLVALLLWRMVHVWAGEPRRLMVFIAGFLLLQTVIALRALGRLLTEKRTD